MNIFATVRQDADLISSSHRGGASKSVTQSTNAILHPWIREQIAEILHTLLEKPTLEEEANREVWKAWQQGLSKRISLSEKLPALRMVLIWDNLQGITPQN